MTTVLRLHGTLNVSALTFPPKATALKLEHPSGLAVPDERMDRRRNRRSQRSRSRTPCARSKTVGRRRTPAGSRARAKPCSTSGGWSTRTLGTSELRQLRSLEEENARLKRVVADRHSTNTSSPRRAKKSEAHTAPRAGRLGSDDLRCQLRAGLSCGVVQSGGVVSPQSGDGPDTAATSDP